MPEWKALSESKILDAMSQKGREAFLPPGIFYWAGRAKKEADINATIGSAYGPASEIGVEGDGQTVFYLPGLNGFFNDLSPSEIFPYAPIKGAPEFRAAWRKWILEKLDPSGRDLDGLLSTPVAAPGVTGAMAIVADLFCSPGESLLLPDRYWGNYNNVLLTNVGARIVTYPFYDEGDFNVAAMKTAVEESLSSQGKAVVVLNFPNNPTGFTPTLATAKKIAAALEEAAVEAGKWVIVLCDDAYEGFVYTDEALEYSIFAELAGKRNVLAVKLDGVSKEFLWYGARIGAITFAVPETLAGKKDLIAGELEDKVGTMIRSSVSNCNHVVQQIIRRALEHKMGTLLAERKKVIDVLGRRWEIYSREMEHADPETVRPLYSNSGFFATVDLAKAKANDVADLLMREYRIGVVPTQRGDQSSLRIAFCSIAESDIPRVASSVIEAATKLSG